ncbi:hypothetical protein Tco_0498264, partial [Tanacetum coccineum]
AALVALQENVPKLVTDHKNAKTLAGKTLASQSCYTLFCSKQL